MQIVFRHLLLFITFFNFAPSTAKCVLKSSSFTFITRLRRVRCNMAASNVHREEGRRPACPRRLWRILPLLLPSSPAPPVALDAELRPGKNAHVRPTCLFLVFPFYCALLWQRGRARLRRAAPGQAHSTHGCFPLVFVYRRKKKTRVMWELETRRRWVSSPCVLPDPPRPSAQAVGSCSTAVSSHELWGPRACRSQEIGGVASVPTLDQ